MTRRLNVIAAIINIILFIAAMAVGLDKIASVSLLLFAGNALCVILDGLMMNRGKNPQ